jgi:hypothetical protein
MSCSHIRVKTWDPNCCDISLLTHCIHCLVENKVEFYFINSLNLKWLIFLFGFILMFAL